MAALPINATTVLTLSTLGVPAEQISFRCVAASRPRPARAARRAAPAFGCAASARPRRERRGIARHGVARR